VFVALVIQHSKSMHPIILSPEFRLALHILAHYLINSMTFTEKLLNVKCVF